MCSGPEEIKQCWELKKNTVYTWLLVYCTKIICLLCYFILEYKIWVPSYGTLGIWIVNRTTVAAQRTSKRSQTAGTSAY